MVSLNSSIIINSSVELDRNIKNLCFTDKMKADLAQVNAKNLSAVIISEFGEEKFSKINSWEHEYNYVKEFVGKNIISKELLARRDKSAFFYNDSAVIMLNGKNHIGIKSTVNGLNLEEEYKIVDGIDDVIERVVPYAFDEDFGYLTATFDNIGTGLTVRVILHLPSLVSEKKIALCKKKLQDFNTCLEPISQDENIGDMYVLKNKLSIGVTEEDILEYMTKAVEYIVNEETRYRMQLYTNNKYKIEDKVFRAIGILKNARMIDRNELLKLTSDIRLGIGLGILNIDVNILNQVIEQTTDISIENKLGRSLNEEEKDIERANLTRILLG